ncbi:hypothetical protein SBRY_30074 [Actinacidiphila bryophytorum]|uniref:Uncharacterized protein n=1 Tax=Actinacidiphila bryophytorum TaxID=1436133 RepID=A0A9W4H0C1_9ACTN|nr:hypothetical protein SBRY_30074 [Actinacidiphila bryophytorum]
MHDVAPLRRDRGRHHRRPGRRHQLRPDQDRCARPLRARRQVQPAAAHRGDPRRRRGLRRPQRLPALQGLTQQAVRAAAGAAVPVRPRTRSRTAGGDVPAYGRAGQYVRAVGRTYVPPERTRGATAWGPTGSPPRPG